MPKLTQAKLKGLIKKTGRHSDTGGLYFRVIGEGKAYWIYRYRVDGKEREASIGPFPALTLAKAREKHAAIRKSVVVDKTDPLAEKRRMKTVRGGCGQSDLRRHGRRLRPDARSHMAQCEASLAVAANADRLLRPDLRHAGQRDHHSRRARGVEAAVGPRAGDRVKAQGTHPDGPRSGAGPRPHPRRQGQPSPLERPSGPSSCPKPVKPSRGHQEALPYGDVPAFVKRLRSSDCMAALALEFLILTATRTGETLGPQWREFDLENGIWTVPSHRMKTGDAFSVPYLSVRSLSLTMRVAPPARSRPATASCSSA